MNTSIKKVLYWAPRILCILFAIFVSLFAFDVFGEGQGFWETILALLKHMVPVYVIVIALVIAWRWECIGAIIFIAIALFYIILNKGESFVIYGPLLVLGVLFLLNWKYESQIK